MKVAKTSEREWTASETMALELPMMPAINLNADRKTLPMMPTSESLRMTAVSSGFVSFSFAFMSPDTLRVALT